MRRWPELRLMGWISAVLFAVFLVLYPWRRSGPHPPGNRALAEMNSIRTAIEQYKAEYSVYPQATPENLLKVLRGENAEGKNPRKIAFLTWNMDSNHMVDPWNTPYQIEFINSDSVLIKSAGKNRVFGDADDIRWPEAQKR